MTAPYREPDLPRLSRKLWISRALGAALLSGLVFVCYRSYGAIQKAAAHSVPSSVIAEEQRKGAEREASEALQAVAPGIWRALHCVDNEEIEYVRGCNFRSHQLFDCSAWADGMWFFLRCRDGLSPGTRGCNGLTTERALPPPARPTEAK